MIPSFSNRRINRVYMLHRCYYDGDDPIVKKAGKKLRLGLGLTNTDKAFLQANVS